MYRLVKTSLILSVILTYTVTGFAQTPVNRPAVSDKELAEKVMQRINGSLWYGLNDYVTADVSNGTVVLTGWTHNTWTADALEQLAGKIEGVESVISQIEPTFGSDELANRAIRAIYSDPLFKNYWFAGDRPIHVIVKNNMLCLAGVVSSAAERYRAEQLVDLHTSANSITNALLINGN